MDDCLFCQIISKALPSIPIYEDEKFYAFLDIHPVNSGHTLVIPKEHSRHLLDATEETARGLMAVTQKIARAVCGGLGINDFNLEMNCGPIAGQIVPHLHMHIVPRHADDGLKHWPGKSYMEGEAEAVAEKIRAAIE
jgi:histidine triad (HIT) family protein